MTVVAVISGLCGGALIGAAAALVGVVDGGVACAA